VFYTDEVLVMARIFCRLRWTVVAISTLLLCSLTAQGADGSADVTYQSTVSEVRLAFFVTDERNHGVETLRADDFAIVDDGNVIRTFRSFQHSPATKLEIVVLVDVSESVISRFRQEIGDVLALISQSQSIANDHISVIAFGGMQQTLVCSENCRGATVAARLLASKAEGATPLYDALWFAGNFLIQHQAPDTRAVVILFSDGEDTISKTGLDTALRAVLASEAQIYAVDLNEAAAYSTGVSNLEVMTQATGGSHLSLHQGAVGVLQAVFEDLHAGYLVTYKLADHAAGFHSLRILPTRNLNLKFRSRQGYIYQSASR